MGGATQPAAHPTTPPQAIATYSVCFPFNPTGWGMSVNPDLSIGAVTPGGIEDQAGVRCEPTLSLVPSGLNLKKRLFVRDAGQVAGCIVCKALWLAMYRRFMERLPSTVGNENITPSAFSADFSSDCDEEMCLV